MATLEEIEAQLDRLGRSGALREAIADEASDEPTGGSETVGVEGPTPAEPTAAELEDWSAAVVAAVMKVMWTDPVGEDIDRRLRRSNRARALRQLASPIEFEQTKPTRPEPETARPPSRARTTAER